MGAEEKGRKKGSGRQKEDEGMKAGKKKGGREGGKKEGLLITF